MIKPTVGRVVWFHPQEPHDQPWAAIVSYVHSDRMVNLAVFNSNGTHGSVTSVPLVQAEDERPVGFYCEWMPYQLGQAAKTEELQKQVSK